MKLAIRLFAAAAEAAGTDNVDLTIDPATTVGQVCEQLREHYPNLQRLPLRVAVNQAFANPDHIIQEHDEVALIPPVSGG